MFGYAQSELTNKPLATLLPSPFAEGHNTFVRRFMDTGVKNVINKTRMVFALHKTGNIFPVRYNRAHCAAPRFISCR